MDMEHQYKTKERKMPNKTKRQPCECYSRAMGFVRPISFFNIGKRAEFEERKVFKEHLCLIRSKNED